MSLELDHLLIPVRGREAAARQLAAWFGVPWGPSRFGPFSAVYVNEQLTIDFDEAEGDYPVQHYAFRVSPERFDAVLARLRAAGVALRSTPHGEVDGQVNTAFGGRMVYWSEPGGHHWELLTVSYARQAPPPASAA